MLAIVFFIALTGLLVCSYWYFVEYKQKHFFTSRPICMDGNNGCQQPQFLPQAFFNVLGWSIFYGLVFFMSLFNLSTSIFVLSLFAGLFSLFLMYFFCSDNYSRCTVCSVIYLINLVLLLFAYLSLANLSVKYFFMNDSVFLKNIGILVLRVVLGGYILFSVYEKHIKKSSSWSWLSEQVGFLEFLRKSRFFNIIVIAVQIVLGLLLVSGFFVRPAALLMLFVSPSAMRVIAQDKNHPEKLFYQTIMTSIFVMLLLSGAGAFSLDNFFYSSF
jgi:uncharacterized membrane protein YphA (DoxX/SURF4 family)